MSDTLRSFAQMYPWSAYINVKCSKVIHWNTSLEWIHQRHKCSQVICLNTSLKCRWSHSASCFCLGQAHHTGCPYSVCTRLAAWQQNICSRHVHYPVTSGISPGWWTLTPVASQLSSRLEELQCTATFVQRTRVCLDDLQCTATFVQRTRVCLDDLRCTATFE